MMVPLPTMFATSSSQLRRRHPLYLTLFGLACWVIAYTFVWDNDAPLLASPEEDTELLRHYHRQLDTAFLNYKQASSTLSSSSAQFEARRLDLSSDSSILSSTCPSISAEAVAKSRILGNTERWHRVVEKMKGPNGDEVVKIAVLGGSVPAGHECASTENVPDHKCAWPSQLETMLRQSSLHNVEIMNLAHGGTPSSTGITQIMELVEYDAIIIQWTANDDNVNRFYGNDAEKIKPHFETLVRTALALPKNPAVIIFESFGTRESEPRAESVHYAIASVYDLPVVSARAAFWQLEEFHAEISVPRKLGNFGGRNTMHMKAIWHQRFACLMYGNWIQESESVLDMSSWIDAANREPAFGGTTLECKESFSASAFSNTLENSPSYVDGWSYYADVPEKYGFISNSTNSTLSFDVAPEKGMNNQLYIHYLRSYSPEWGTAHIEVSGGSSELILDSHTDEHESQLAEIKMKLGGSDDPYKVTIRNIQGKVKIVELFLYSCKQD